MKRQQLIELTFQEFSYKD